MSWKTCDGYRGLYDGSFVHSDLYNTTNHLATTFNQNVGAWNTASMSTMASMFDGAAVFNQNLAGWNVASAANALSAFNGAAAFNQNLARRASYAHNTT
jgi:hypothetical protein